MTYKIALVGEAWGAEEETQRAPFVGASGWELNKMLAEAGIHRADCFITNVFNLQPKPTNDIENLCGAKDLAIAGLPSLRPGKFVRAEFHKELIRLLCELSEVQPNVIVALGNTPCWALLHNTGITKIRGTVTASTVVKAKVVPTFHPAAVLRDWSLRAVTVLDLAKAKRESEFPEIRRPERTVYIEPSLSDMESYFEKELALATSISFDIETRGDEITCIGFAPSEKSAIVIPFTDARKSEGSYWPDLDSEHRAWAFTRKVLSLPCPKFGQNTLYDINFLWAKYGIVIVNYQDDTMLLHHALQPESLKGLGFLGSVYTNESSWKLLNRRTATIKRDA